MEYHDNTNNKGIKELLQKTDSNLAPINFTDNLMEKVDFIAVRDKTFKKYFHRSIYLTALSVILLIISLITASDSVLAFSIKPHSYAFLMQNFQYLSLSFATGMILYQLNNILSIKTTAHLPK